jgi:hypothetical protein
VLRRILPCAAKLAGSDVVASDVAVHQFLISRATEFHDDIVDASGEDGVTNQFQPQLVPLFVAVTAFVKCDDIV